MRTSTSFLSMLGCLSLLLTGCAQREPPDLAEIRVAVPGGQTGTSTLDPANAPHSNSLFSLLYDTLIYRDGASNFHPHLAQSWTASEDGLTWTFQLRDDVTFHNGKPFTAATAKWTLERVKASRSSYFASTFDSIEAAAPHVLRIRLTQPDPRILLILSMPYFGMLEPESVTALGARFGIEQAIGSGPFKLRSFTASSETRLERNPAYRWGPPVARNRGPATVERIRLRQFADDNAVFVEFVSGGLDVIQVTPIDYMKRLEADGTATIAMPTKRLSYIAFNTTKGPLQEIAVRDALAHAINRKSIRHALYYDTGFEGDTLLVNSVPASRVASRFHIDHDPARTRTLLERAGWKLGADGVRAKDGVSLVLNLWTINTTDLRRLAEVLQAQLAEVGVKIAITTLDAAVLDDQAKAGKHDLLLRTYAAIGIDILPWLWSAKHIGMSNVSMWDDARSEELRSSTFETSRTLEEQTRNAIAYHEHLLSNYVAAPIFQPVTYISYDPRRVAMASPFLAQDFDSVAALDMSLHMSGHTHPAPR